MDKPFSRIKEFFSSVTGRKLTADEILMKGLIEKHSECIKSGLVTLEQVWTFGDKSKIELRHIENYYNGTSFTIEADKNLGDEIFAKVTKNRKEGKEERFMITWTKDDIFITGEHAKPKGFIMMDEKAIKATATMRANVEFDKIKEGAIFR